MLHRFFLPLLVLVLFTGCSSVRTVSTADDARTSYSDVNRAVRGKVVRIAFANGESVSVTGVHVSPDSLTWVDMRGNKLRSERMSNVREISIVKAGRGAVVGLLAGAVVGAGLGVARAYQQGDDPASDPVGVDVEEKARNFATAHALYVSLVTTPLGAIIGSRNKFRFDHEPEMPAGQYSQKK